MEKAYSVLGVTKRQFKHLTSETLVVSKELIAYSLQLDKVIQFSVTADPPQSFSRSFLYTPA